ncbi:hypothetical protein MATL_G00244560, partial [Megalops atlanticus]
MGGATICHQSLVGTNQRALLQISNSVMTHDGSPQCVRADAASPSRDGVQRCLGSALWGESRGGHLVTTAALPALRSAPSGGGCLCSLSSSWACSLSTLASRLLLAILSLSA